MLGFCLPLLAACGGEAPSARQGPALGRAEQGFVNGDDDRREYFELNDPAQLQLMEQSAVALMPELAARQIYRGNVNVVPTWGETNDLCPSEPFEDQPSAAFCSGVLVDWDLVLTSGHCVDVLPLRSMRVGFGYYFWSPGELALAQADVYRIKEIIVARDDQGAKERLDFAWLRLTEPVRPPHAPAALRNTPPEVALGDAIVSINAGGGAPLKLDAGGRVQNLREGVEDYFVVDTDTSEGSSGGPAFNANLEVVGTLARGAPDFVPTAAGCVVTDKETNPQLAREQFTYAYRSVEGLCDVEPDHWLCDPSCGGSCELPPSPALIVHEDGGCTLAAPRSAAGGVHVALAGIALALATAARRARRADSRLGPVRVRALTS